MPQGEQAQEPCNVQCYQVEEEPKSPLLLNSMKKVQITDTPLLQTKSVRKESVEMKSEGKGTTNTGVRELSEKAKSFAWDFLFSIKKTLNFHNISTL